MNRYLSLRLVIGFGLVVLFASACGAVTPAPIPTPIPPAPTPTPIPPTATTVPTIEEYKPVHYTEIACAFKDYNYRGVVGEGGTLVPMDGEIGEFRCALGAATDRTKLIELVAKIFKDGFVETKKFGRIKVLFRASVTGGDQYVIFMTDKQKAELKEYLSRQ